MTNSEHQDAVLKQVNITHLILRHAVAKRHVITSLSNIKMLRTGVLSFSGFTIRLPPIAMALQRNVTKL